MGYTLVKEVISLLENFEAEAGDKGFTRDITGFKQWIHASVSGQPHLSEPHWEGKEKGRSAESAISTFLVHMNRYAKTYAKSAIHGSEFATQEDFIYLINLKAFGSMGKMELIKRNIQEKSAGMQIINRLIGRGWAAQKDSPTDKRSKTIYITDAGAEALDAYMDKIRLATRIVTGDLSRAEKMELIRLLDKLDRFHKPIFLQNRDNATLLDEVSDFYLPQGQIAPTENSATTGDPLPTLTSKT